MLNNKRYNEIINDFNLLNCCKDSLEINFISNKIIKEVDDYFDSLSYTDSLSEDNANFSLEILKLITLSTEKIIDNVNYRRSIDYFLRAIATREDVEKLNITLFSKNIYKYSITNFSSDGYMLKRSGSHSEIINKIIVDKNINYEEISRELYSRNISPCNFKTLYYNYFDHKLPLDEENYIRSYNKLNKFYSYYNKYVNKIKENVYIDKIMGLVKEFLNSDEKNISVFCKKNRVSIEAFNKFMNIYKHVDKDTVDKKMNAIKTDDDKIYSIAVNVISFLKNGIPEEDGSTRKFDIFDYYCYTLQDLSELLCYVKSSNKFNVNDKKELSKFCTAFIESEMSELEVDKLLKSKHIINPLCDHNGRVIAGSGRVITEAEKISIIEYLKSNNIPLTSKTYRAAFNRFKENKLFAKEENKKIKTLI